MLFSEKYCEEIKNIFENNFITNFNNYLETNFENDEKNICPRYDINSVNDIFEILFLRLKEEPFFQL